MRGSEKQEGLIIREAVISDRDFILSLSPVLAGVAGLPWHSRETIAKFQTAYILSMLDAVDGNHMTYVAELGGDLCGFVHMCDHEDEISGEECATVPLLAVSESVQGKGIGKALMDHAEQWSRDQGYRLMHLEVFADNHGGQKFYNRIGFQSDTLMMVKPLG